MGYPRNPAKVFVILTILATSTIPFLGLLSKKMHATDSNQIPCIEHKNSNSDNGSYTCKFTLNKYGSPHSYTLYIGEVGDSSQAILSKENDGKKTSPLLITHGLVNENITTYTRIIPFSIPLELFYHGPGNYNLTINYTDMVKGQRGLRSGNPKIIKNSSLTWVILKNSSAIIALTLQLVFIFSLLVLSSNLSYPNNKTHIWALRLNLVFSAISIFFISAIPRMFIELNFAMRLTYLMQLIGISYSTLYILQLFVLKKNYCTPPLFKYTLIFSLLSFPIYFFVDKENYFSTYLVPVPLCVLLVIPPLISGYKILTKQYLPKYSSSNESDTGLLILLCSTLFIFDFVNFTFLESKFVYINQYLFYGLYSWIIYSLYSKSELDQILMEKRIDLTTSYYTNSKGIKNPATPEENLAASIKSSFNLEILLITKNGKSIYRDQEYKQIDFYPQRSLSKERIEINLNRSNDYTLKLISTNKNTYFFMGSSNNRKSIPPYLLFNLDFFYRLLTKIINIYEIQILMFYESTVHDIQGPIRSINRALNSISELKESDELKIASESLKQCLDLIHTRNRPNLTNLVVETNISLIDLIKIIYISLTEDSNLKNIKIENSLIAPLSSLFIPSSILKSIFYNLILNSQEALEDSERCNLHIKIQELKHYFLVSYSDNGPGIKKEHLPHIFNEKFTYGKRNGTGIGLYNIKKNLELFCGEIGYFPNDNPPSFKILLPKKYPLNILSLLLLKNTAHKNLILNTNESNKFYKTYDEFNSTHLSLLSKNQDLLLISKKEISKYSQELIKKCEKSTIAILDDDPLILATWKTSAKVANTELMSFSSPLQFLQYHPFLPNTCAIYLDNQLNSLLTGLDIYNYLATIPFSKHLNIKLFDTQSTKEFPKALVRS